MVAELNRPEFASLQQFSAKLGADSLLVQASTGNTSLKVDGTLWIKASGKWLAHARQSNAFIPVDLMWARCCVDKGLDIADEAAGCNGSGLRPSIETSMHAVLPHRVVVHVHSINTINWAVRRDGPNHLRTRLAGLHWQWVPYVPSGLPLAQAIQQVLKRAEDTDIFVLANHGLVICAETCEAAGNLLEEVESRVAVKPRCAPRPNSVLLEQISEVSDWRLPDAEAVHVLGTDDISRRILTGGVLYPCQAIFFGEEIPVLSCRVACADTAQRAADFYSAHSFLIVEGGGVMVHRDMTGAEYSILVGLAQVLQRMEPCAEVRYLDATELQALTSANAAGYRELSEKH